MEEADRLCERLAIVDHGRILTLDTPDGAQALAAGRPGARPVAARAEPLAPRSRRLAGVIRLEPVPEATDAGAAGGRAAASLRRPEPGLLDRVLAAVRDGGADLRHVSLAQPSLEDVYIHLTGRGLRE